MGFFFTFHFISFQLTNNDGGSAVTNNIEVIFAGSKRHESGPSSSKNDNNMFAQHQYSNQFNSCRTLQRKLELKVERAKKNFSQNSENESFNVVSCVCHNSSCVK